MHLRDRGRSESDIDYKRYWERGGYASQNLRPTFKSGREIIGIWGCFCGDEMGPLYVLPKGQNMTAKRYHYVLQRHFIPFYNRMRRKYGNQVVI